MPESKSIPHYDYSIEELAWVPAFIDDVKDYFFPRPEDNLLILRPNKVMHLNKTAMKMLQLLFEGQDAKSIVDHFVTVGAEEQVVLCEQIQKCS